MQKMYTCDAIDKLAQRYYEKGGEVWEVIPGVLGYGVTIMFGDGLKMAVVKEHVLNCWSSYHTVRFFNKYPKKYLKALEMSLNEEPYETIWKVVA